MNKALACLGLIAAAALSGCGSKSDAPDAAPANVVVTPRDGGVSIAFTQEPGLTYSVFYAAASSIAFDGRASLPGYNNLYNVSSPRAITGLVNGTTYSFIVAAASSGSKVGPASESVSVVPRMAGATWVSGAPLGSIDYNGVTYDKTRFFAVGDGGALRSSTDAVTWTSLSSGTSARLNAALFANTRYVAVGDSGATVLSTDAGATWTGQTIVTPNALRGLGYFGGQFIAVGDQGTILTSSDGANWNTRNSGTTQSLSAVAASAGRVVAVGASGTLLASTDLANWSPVISPVSADLKSVVYGTNAFVAVGSAGTVLTSADGVSWSQAGSPLAENLRAVTWGSQFVATGANGAILTSTDGSTWVRANSGTNSQFNAVVFGAGLYSAVGAVGANLITP